MRALHRVDAHDQPAGIRGHDRRQDGAGRGGEHRLALTGVTAPVAGEVAGQRHHVGLEAAELLPDLLHPGAGTHRRQHAVGPAVLGLLPRREALRGGGGRVGERLLDPQQAELGPIRTLELGGVGAIEVEHLGFARLRPGLVEVAAPQREVIERRALESAACPRPDRAVVDPGPRQRLIGELADGGRAARLLEGRAVLGRVAALDRLVLGGVEGPALVEERIALQHLLGLGVAGGHAQPLGLEGEELMLDEALEDLALDHRLELGRNVAVRMALILGQGLGGSLVKLGARDADTAHGRHVVGGRGGRPGFRGRGRRFRLRGRAGGRDRGRRRKQREQRHDQERAGSWRGAATTWLTTLTRAWTIH